MKYGMLVRGDNVYLMECRNDDSFLAEHPGSTVFLDYSKAIESMHDAIQQYVQVYFYSTNNEGLVTILATPDHSTFDELQGKIDGPFDDPIIAYGYEHFIMAGNDDYNSYTRQFYAHTHVTFDRFCDCGDHKYCRVKLTDLNDVFLNIRPLNSTRGIKPGEQKILRLLGYAKKFRVFSSSEDLRKEVFMPVDVIIPTGIYQTDPCNQDCSVVFTGIVKNAFSFTSKDYRRYQLVVRSASAEVNLDVFTHYEIHAGDYVYVSTELSAYFS